MFKYLFTFRSLTYAQRSQNILKKSGVFSGITRLPISLTNKGCSYGIRINARDYDRAYLALQRGNFTPEKVFIEQDGRFSEVG